MPLIRGDVYAGFEIVHSVGSGATGSVYLAQDSETATWVALKIVRSALSADAHFRRRLHEATEMAAGVDDPGVARVLNFGEYRGRLWVATEYIDGLDADRLLRQRFPSGMPHRSVCVIADCVARALDAAHARELIHRDVKPTNILLGNPFSDNYRILLTDFGHGHIEDRNRGESSGAPEDALRYAAPELIAGASLDGRTDQFALAATVFQLLTAEPAFHGGARTVTEDGVVRFDTHALSDRPTSVPGLDHVFATAFAFDPAARFDTCHDFVKDLSMPATDSPPPRRVSDPQPRRRVPPDPPGSDPPDLPGAVSGPPGDSVTPTGSKGLRRSVLLPAAAAMLVALALTVAGVVLGKPHPSPQAVTATSGANGASRSPAPAAAEAGCTKLDAAVAHLSRRQKLAQLLMVGVKGIDDARAVVNGNDVGGIMIASWTDLSMLGDGELRDLQAAPSPLPLAVSVDEEGGRVQRLKIQLGDQLSPRELVAQNTTVQQVHDIALKRGTLMKGYGITIDFAPVVDVTDAPDDTVIGDRSFSADPATVVAYAGAYAQGLRDAGLLPVLKHFPGHGRASGDSHEGSVTTPPLSDLMTLDLIPYRELSAEHPVGVMVGHMQVPGLTGTDPASLSAAAYSLLRQGDYGGPPFTGPIFTDDLSSMGAINQRYSVPDAVLRALQAGADTALWTTTDQVPAVLDRLEQAVDAHELDMARVNDALSHVATAKNPELACAR
jgi:beta-glucosidase-like glycosyl hydrolase/serine/threonine protein kinase